MVNLYQLQIFVAVSERGTFSAAAEQFNLTQPGVSQQIRALETTYKVRLFNRNGPRIELTEAGQRLLEIARPLVEQAAQVEERFSAGLGVVRGRVSLIYTKNTAAALYFLPPLLADFQLRHTGVRFSLGQSSEELALEMLLEHQIHFAMLSNPPRQKSLESFLLHSSDLVLVLPPGHTWQGKPICLRDLRGQPFLLRSSGSLTRRMTDTALRTAGLSLSDLQPVAEFDSAEGVVLAAQAGMGIGFATSTIVERYLAHRLVGCAQIELTEKERAAGIDLRHEIHLTRLVPTSTSDLAPSQERFWEFMGSRTHPK